MDLVLENQDPLTPTLSPPGRGNSLERPTETSDATVAVAPDLCVGRRSLRAKCQGRVNCSFTYATLKNG